MIQNTRALTDWISNRTRLWVARGSLQSVGKGIKRCQSTSAMTRGHGQNPMAKKWHYRSPLQSESSREGFSATSLASSDSPSWVQWGTESKSLYKWKNDTCGQSLQWRWAVLSTHSSALRVQTNVKTMSTHWPHPRGSERISRYWVAKANQEMSRWHVTSNSGGKAAQPTFLLLLACFVPGICLPSDLPPWAGSDAHTRTVRTLVRAPHSNPTQHPETNNLRNKLFPSEAHAAQIL